MPTPEKIALVTGVSSGIGRATALALARSGYEVVGCARRGERLSALETELSALGRRPLLIRADVTQPEDVDRLFAQLRERFTALDLLVNNAGVGLFGPVSELALAQLEQAFALNVFALVRVTQQAVPLMRGRTGATIVNVSSVLGHRGLPFLGGYGASKAAVNLLTESLRAELAADGIRVLLVSPGLTDTEFREHRLHAEGHTQDAIPLDAMSADAVAEQLLTAVRRKRRTTVLTGPGRLMVLGNRYAPGLFDRVARRMVSRMMSKRGATS